MLLQHALGEIERHTVFTKNAPSLLLRLALAFWSSTAPVLLTAQSADAPTVKLALPPESLVLKTGFFGWQVQVFPNALRQLVPGLPIKSPVGISDLITSAEDATDVFLFVVPARAQATLSCQILSRGLRAGEFSLHIFGPDGKRIARTVSENEDVMILTFSARTAGYYYAAVLETPLSERPGIDLQRRFLLTLDGLHHPVGQFALTFSGVTADAIDRLTPEASLVELPAPKDLPRRLILRSEGSDDEWAMILDRRAVPLLEIDAPQPGGGPNRSDFVATNDLRHDLYAVVPRSGGRLIVNCEILTRARQRSATFIIHVFSPEGRLVSRAYDAGANTVSLSFIARESGPYYVAVAEKPLRGLSSSSAAVDSLLDGSGIGRYLLTVTR